MSSISHKFVFAAGDCAALEGSPRPKAGVWAVRAGAPLAENLRRAATGRPLERWRPQRDALAILGLGHGRAVAWRNGLSLQGRKIGWLKDRIDRRWMSMYSGHADAGRSGRSRCAAAAAARRWAPRCWPARWRPCRIGDSPDLMETRDDAAVLKPPIGKLLVQSVHHFRAFLDDPFVFGQIAAAHALSDLHAMGAAPWTALAIASVPYGPAAKCARTCRPCCAGRPRC